METFNAPGDHPSPPHGWLLATVIMIGVGIVVAYGLQRVNKERVDYRDALRTVNGMLALPEDASRERVYEVLSRYLEEHNEAKRARIARQLGIEPDWVRIMDRISHLNSERKSEIYRSIAEEYTLPASLTQNDIQRRFLSSKGALSGGTKLRMMPAMHRARILAD